MSAPASVTPTPVAPAAESSTAAENSTGRAPLGSHGWKRCMRFVDYSLKHCKSRAQAMARDGNCCTRSLPAAAPRIHALLRKIEGRGCQLATSPVVCEDIFAGLPMVGAFDPARRVVVMNPALGDAATSQAEWTRTITHELVHAYDDCRVAVRVCGASDPTTALCSPGPRPSTAGPSRLSPHRLHGDPRGEPLGRLRLRS